MLLMSAPRALLAFCGQHPSNATKTQDAEKEREEGEARGSQEDGGDSNSPPVSLAKTAELVLGADRWVRS